MENKTKVNLLTDEEREKVDREIAEQEKQVKEKEASPKKLLTASTLKCAKAF